MLSIFKHIKNITYCLFVLMFPLPEIPLIFFLCEKSLLTLLSWLCELVVYVLKFDFYDYDFITFKFFEVDDGSFIIFVALNSV